MHLVNIFIGIFLGFFSLGLILFVVYSICSPFLSFDLSLNPRSFAEKWRFNKKKKLLSEVSKLVEAGASDGASKYLRNCFYLEQIRRNPPLITELNGHHLSVLGTVLTLAERKGTRLKNLAVVEDLLNTRTQLMKTYLETVETRRELFSKKRSEGKKIPAWATQEYQKKMADIQDRLKTNRQSLTGQIDELLDALEKAQSEEEATYH